MTSTYKKGNKGKYKTKKWFLEKGYSVEYTEILRTTPFFYKKDILFSDGVAYNKKEFILWQAKLNTKVKSQNVADAVKKYKELKLPKCIQKWVIVWMPRMREPKITKV